MPVETIEIGKQKIEVGIKQLPMSFQMQLDTEFGNLIFYGDNAMGQKVNVGRIKNIVLQETLESLRVNGTDYKIDPNDPLHYLPLIEDMEYQMYAVDKIVAKVVKHNQVLARREPVNGVFQPFLAEPFLDANELPNDVEGQKRMDPTASQQLTAPQQADTPTTDAGSSSDTPENPSTSSTPQTEDSTSSSMATSSPS